VFFYIYAVIGMELFSGLINYYGYDTKNETEMFCGDQRLKGSEFLQKRYCGNNFNSIAHSFVILFELLVVNQWHDILYDDSDNYNSCPCETIPHKLI